MQMGGETSLEYLGPRKASAGSGQHLGTSGTVQLAKQRGCLGKLPGHARIRGKR